MLEMELFKKGITTFHLKIVPMEIVKWVEIHLNIIFGMRISGTTHSFTDFKLLFINFNEYVNLNTNN